MPDISELNGTAIDNVAEFDGLTVTGVTPPLDTYTNAAAAYSVRLLRTAYTGDIMRVRRDSDQNEIDVGFDSNDEFGLTSPVSNATSGGPFTDFADFIGHGGTPANGFIRYWYDQSGNANDAGQATQASQPQIYDATTGLITENGKPAITATTSQLFDVSSPPTFSDFTFTIVSKKTGSSTGIIAYDNSSGFIHPTRSNGAPYMEAFVSPAKDVLFYDTLGNTSSIGSRANNQILSYGYRSSTSADAGTNGEGNTTATVGTDTFTLRTLLDYGGNATFSFAGEVQEIIFWSTSKNSDRSDLEDNINRFFCIY